MVVFVTSSPVVPVAVGLVVTTSEIEETGHKLANNCIRYIDTSFTVQKHILCHHDILNKTF